MFLLRVNKAECIKVGMFKFLVLGLLAWLILCLTPLGEALEKIVDSWAVKRVEETRRGHRSLLPKVPKQTKRTKW